MASWIEMSIFATFRASATVEAYMASWIEIALPPVPSGTGVLSRLIWPRGLKYIIVYFHKSLECRGLYGLVD